MVTRLPWCLAAGWGVVALLRAVATPRTPVKPAGRARPTVLTTPPTDDEHDPTD